MDIELNSKKQYRGLVVFDVDGVIFRSVFLIRIARTTGLRNYIRTLLLGWRYYRNRIDSEVMLAEGFKFIRDFDAQEAIRIADGMRRSNHIEQTMRILHEKGYFISLISSGIPNFILSHIARDIGADHFSGIDTAIKDGNIQADRLRAHPKDEIVRELLHQLDLDWDSVASVVDDPNNLQLMTESKIGIGFNPSRIIRANADIVVDGYDMLEIIPHIVPKDQLPDDISLKDQLFKREVYRKSIHFLGVPIPFLAYLNKPAVAAVLFAVILIYIFSEFFRTIGVHLPFISHITKRSERITETRNVITGPISLTAGILITLFAFTPKIYIPAILIVCISDSVSSLVGRKFGRLRLPFYERTLEGSIAFYAASLAILIFFLPFEQALLTALIPTVLELIMPHYLDNLFIPIGTALFMRYVH
jgi:dolichol kinase/phosphoserine phosphatase